MRIRKSENQTRKKSMKSGNEFDNFINPKTFLQKYKCYEANLDAHNKKLSDVDSKINEH